MYNSSNLRLQKVERPKLGYAAHRPEIPNAVFADRVRRLCARMQEKRLDALVIYADREHYANFKYFVGFDVRFEEGLLVIHADGTAFCALGNECLANACNAKIALTPVLCQVFSLPNQPMEQFVSMAQVLAQCGLQAHMRVGCVDWKLFTTADPEQNQAMFGIPAYLYQAIADTVGDSALLSNETPMLIAPGTGLRMRAEASAIAAFEFGACCASQAVLDMMEAVTPGMTEMQLADCGSSFGQPLTCHDYIVGGKNTARGLISPTDYPLQNGDDLVLCKGLEGGLTCRRGMLAEYDEAHREFLEEIVKPYMAAVFNWYEMIGIGTQCGAIYDMIQAAIPAERFGWKLNPGHMVAYEEWMCSPIYKGSKVKIESGMMFQMDIIPSIPGKITPNAEDGLAIADEALRNALMQDYPEVYDRIMQRRKFAEEQIGIKLKPEVLPLSNCFAAYCPFFLSRDLAVTL